MTPEIAAVVCTLLVVLGALAGLWIVHVVSPVRRRQVDLLASRLDALELKSHPVQLEDFDELRKRVATLSTVAGFKNR